MFRNGTAANKYSFGILWRRKLKLISTKRLGFSLGKASATAIE
jgi:hypothetical protein